MKNNEGKDQDKILKAIAFACEKHSSQKRKGAPWPYIVHIYEVFQILQENNADSDTLIAGVLHDTVEDTGTSLDEICSMFGYRVASFVDILSENKALPYAKRKAVQAERIKNAPKEAKMVKCADCLSNIKSIYFDEKRGEDIWNKFNSTKDNIKEHYHATIESISDLGEMKMFKELKEYYQNVFDEEVIKAPSKETSKESKATFSVKAKEETKKKTEGTIKQKELKPYVYVGSKKICDCTECKFMSRRRTPDPYDWFNDDDEEYSCDQLGRVLSGMNRPYEKQPIPSDCPFREIAIGE